MEDHLGAFCSHTQVTIEGRAGGPLAGLTFAAKDLFDVEGFVTGAGNADYLATHGPARATAPAVQALIDAGATLVGKTHTDELAFGLLGRNAHYGTPTNPKAPDRVPGGSSSGSAAAVAGGLVDTALGTDTGGSVRIPASFCGLYGIRPTHGRISDPGVVPLALSFDTVGCFARDAATLARVADVLLPRDATRPPPQRLLIATDVFARADTAVRDALQPSVVKLGALVGAVAEQQVCPGDLKDWIEAFRVLQSFEAWQADGPWIERTNPRFGPDVTRRFAFAKTVTAAQRDAKQPVRDAARTRLAELLSHGGVLALPTAPFPAPKRTILYGEIDALRDRILAGTCIAGLSGFPQVNLPVATVDGGPVGLSILGAAGTDRMLLELAQALAKT
ncbi:MAG: amidase [Proteobacteria bacterium]|nr:amidase [Pseudomonadota bacterium]